MSNINAIGIGGMDVSSNSRNLGGLNNVNELSKIGSVSSEVKNAAAQDKVSQKAVRQDSFVKSKEFPDEKSTGIYSKESLVEQLKNAEAQRVQTFEQTIQKMAEQQGLGVKLNFRGQDIYVTKEDSEKAAQSIADGGEYSVEKVAGRIMDMAKALAGGDESKIDKLRDAVIKGFEGAAGILGKKGLDDMPEITKKTYSNVMQQFDDWKKSTQTNAKETMRSTAVNNITQQAVASKVAKAPENNVGAQTEAAAAVSA